MKRVMIVGCPRSGTTLLQQLIGTNPEVFAPPETSFFAMLLRSHGVGFWDRFYLPESRFLKWKDFVEKDRILKLDPQLLPPKNRQEAVRYFIQTMDFNASADGKRCWVEKTPVHAFSVRYILPLAPDVRVLHMIRHLEDVVASLKDVSRRYPKIWWRRSLVKKVEKIIAYVDKCVKASLVFAGQPNHYFVRYERLVADPEKELNKIFNFIQLWTDQNLMRYILEHFGEKKIYRDEEKWKMGYGNRIHKDRKGKFKTLFDAEEQAYIRKRLQPACRLLEEKLGP